MNERELKELIVECLIEEVEGDEFNPEDLPKSPDWKKAKFVRPGTPEYVELMRQIQSGQIKRTHLYDIRNILRPRGPMQKESLSLEIYDYLKEAFDLFLLKLHLICLWFLYRAVRDCCLSLTLLPTCMVYYSLKQILRSHIL